MGKGTAIETPIKVSVRLTILKGKQYVKTPHFQARVQGFGTSGESREEYYCTTGIGPGEITHFRFPKAFNADV